MEVGHRGQYGLLATNRVVMATMFEQELALTHCPCMVAAFVKECQKKKHHVGALPAQVRKQCDRCLKVVSLPKH